MNDYQILLDALHSIEKKDVSLRGSICSDVRYYFQINDLSHLKPISKLVDFFPGWKHFSGFENYPVPASEREDPDTSFHIHNRLNTLWKGKQGELREDLLEHCINFCQRELGICEVRL